MSSRNAGCLINNTALYVSLPNPRRLVVRRGFFFIFRPQKIDFRPSIGYITGTNLYQAVYTSNRIQ